MLFDEIEKAHPDVFNTLLQILEEGRLTDAQGRSVDFRNTVLIMTSNLGTADLRKANLGFGRADEAITYERMKEKVNDALKQHFRPEFLNRIDETIVFHELSQAEVTQIVDLMIARTQKQLEGQGIGIELTPAAKQLVAERGYDPTLGARPLRRAIQRLIEDALSEKLLYKEFRAGEIIVVDAEPDPETGEMALTFKGVEGFEPPPMELAETGSHGGLTPRSLGGSVSTDDLTWEPPGPGQWYASPEHMPTPVTRLFAELFRQVAVGWARGADRYGLPPNHGTFGAVNCWFYYSQGTPKPVDVDRLDAARGGDARHPAMARGPGPLARGAATSHGGHESRPARGGPDRPDGRGAGRPPRADDRALPRAWPSALRGGPR